MRSISLAMALGMMFPGGVAFAVAATEVPPGAPANLPTKIVPSSHAEYVDGFGQSIDAGTLGELSGGTDVVNQMTLNGNVSDNKTDHSTSGFNTIATGAFSGAVGLPMVIQNSGNGVLIQNATIVSVQFQP